jgi:hypothetical protein
MVKGCVNLPLAYIVTVVFPETFPLLNQKKEDVEEMIDLLELQRQQEIQGC